MTTKTTPKANQPQATTGDKRPYVAPELTEYGNVREFTRGAKTSKADSKVGAQF